MVRGVLDKVQTRYHSLGNSNDYPPTLRSIEIAALAGSASLAASEPVRRRTRRWHCVARHTTNSHFWSSLTNSSVPSNMASTFMSTSVHIQQTTTRKTMRAVWVRSAESQSRLQGYTLAAATREKSRRVSNT